MSLAQDLRNAWDFRDRDEFERLLTVVAEHALVVKLATRSLDATAATTQPASASSTSPPSSPSTS